MTEGGEVPQTMTGERIREYEGMYNTLLTPQQDLIYRQILHHLTATYHFVIVAAGTVSCYLLAKLHTYYRQHDYHVERLAPTGVAAYNIYGETIHRFMGMTNERNEVNKLKLNDHVKLYRTSVFLVDKFSMISVEMLRHISSAFIEVTNRNAPFGGVQFVFFGDVRQLLTVEAEQGYIWQSSPWHYGNKLQLTQPIRQEGHSDYAGILNKIRVYDLDPHVVHFIRQCCYDKRDILSHAIRLYITRHLANLENARMIDALPGVRSRHDAVDYPPNNPMATSILNPERRLPKMLLLKKDITVMLTHNLDVEHGWTNGYLAVVEEVCDGDYIRLRHLSHGYSRVIGKVSDYVYDTVYSRTQFPFVLAMASTVHKVQSLKLPAVAIFLPDMPSHGKFYVALSRVPRPQDVYRFGLTPTDDTNVRLRANCDAIEIMKRLFLNR